MKKYKKELLTQEDIEDAKNIPLILEKNKALKEAYDSVSEELTNDKEALAIKYESPSLGNDILTTIEGYQKEQDEQRNNALLRIQKDNKETIKELKEQQKELQRIKNKKERAEVLTEDEIEYVKITRPIVTEEKPLLEAYEKLTQTTKKLSKSYEPVEGKPIEAEKKEEPEVKGQPSLEQSTEDLKTSAKEAQTIKPTEEPGKEFYDWYENLGKSLDDAEKSLSIKKVISKKSLQAALKILGVLEKVIKPISKLIDKGAEGFANILANMQRNRDGFSTLYEKLLADYQKALKGTDYENNPQNLYKAIGLGHKKIEDITEADIKEAINKKTNELIKKVREKAQKEKRSFSEVFDELLADNKGYKYLQVAKFILLNRFTRKTYNAFAQDWQLLEDANFPTDDARNTILKSGNTKIIEIDDRMMRSQREVLLLPTPKIIGVNEVTTEPIIGRIEKLRIHIEDKLRNFPKWGTQLPE